MSLFTVNPAQAIKFIKKCMKVHEVPLLKSAPGMGKSDIINGIATELNLYPIDVRLAQKESVDLGGMPDLSGDYATYKQFDEFPTEKTKVPEGYNGWLIFCDELTQAKRDVQGAFHKLALDRMVGQEKLHENAFLVCAGNRTQDRAGANGLITSLQSRLVHFTLNVEFEADFMPYALEQGYDARIISFLNFKNELLNNFDPLHSEDTYACSRTWFKLHKLIQNEPNLSAEWAPLIVGTIGQAAGSEFRTFCDIWQDLPSIESIVNSPSTAPISPDSATQYAMVGMLTTKADADNLDSFVAYIKRFEPELQLIFLRLTSKQFLGALRIKAFQLLLREFNAEMKAYA